MVGLLAIPCFLLSSLTPSDESRCDAEQHQLPSDCALLVALQASLDLGDSFPENCVVLHRDVHARTHNSLIMHAMCVAACCDPSQIYVLA